MKSQTYYYAQVIEALTEAGFGNAIKSQMESWMTIARMPSKTGKAGKTTTDAGGSEQITDNLVLFPFKKGGDYIQEKSEAEKIMDEVNAKVGNNAALATILLSTANSVKPFLWEDLVDDVEKVS
ncbi:MAG: hypothetical protein KAW12_07020 [Candidatus Aminicenantes bacterium]|nr:hypothetical protein [Candidatus Aminicenantes bacterium]